MDRAKKIEKIEKKSKNLKFSLQKISINTNPIYISKHINISKKIV
jgi:hypothetical protein